MEAIDQHRNKNRRGVVVQPILTQNVMSRGQVDLIDMQSQLDCEFKFHFSKFCIRRPLKHKTASSVAKVLVEIFSNVARS